MVADTAAKTGTPTWLLDPAHSSVEFAVRHMMMTTVRGRFKDLNATLTGDRDNPEKAGVEATIDVASIDRQELRGAAIAADLFERRVDRVDGANGRLAAQRFTDLQEEIVTSRNGNDFGRCARGRTRFACWKSVRGRGR